MSEPRRYIFLLARGEHGEWVEIGTGKKLSVEYSVVPSQDYDALERDRDAKTKRMWELGKECDALAARVERAEHALAIERGKLEAADALVESLQNRWASRPLSVEDTAALEAENDRLAARVAELEKDAARYRWLRHGNDSSILHQPACEIAEGLSGHEWDRAIDKAMGFAAADEAKHG